MQAPSRWATRKLVQDHKYMYTKYIYMSCLIGWFSDWWIDWSIAQLTDIESLSDGLIDRSVDWLIDLIDWSINRKNHPRTYLIGYI